MEALSQFFTANAVWVHLSYAILAAAFLMRSLYWLRVLAIAAFLTQAVYLALTTSGLYTDIQWAFVFVAINLAQLALLTRQKSQSLPPAERAMLRRVLPSLSDSQLARFCGAAERREIAAGEPMTRQGAPVERLYFLLSGAADVAIDAVDVARVSAGSFIGEMSFLTGRPASADVKAAFDSVALVFEKNALDSALARDEDLRSAVQTLIGADLAEKVARGNRTLRERLGESA
jgi:CRP-like cAMP-binding protein